MAWSKDNRPARKKYWASRTLEKNKVKRILNNNQPKKKDGEPMTKREVTEWWQSQRSSRVPDSYNRAV
jgi:hypothetical protein